MSDDFKYNAYKVKWRLLMDRVILKKHVLSLPTVRTCSIVYYLEVSLIYLLLMIANIPLSFQCSFRSYRIIFGTCFFAVLLSLVLDGFE